MIRPTLQDIPTLERDVAQGTKCYLQPLAQWLVAAMAAVAASKHTDSKEESSAGAYTADIPTDVKTSCKLPAQKKCAVSHMCNRTALLGCHCSWPANCSKTHHQ
jgi:hypothetical protein